MKKPNKFGYVISPILIGLVSLSMIPMCWADPSAPGCLKLGEHLYSVTIAGAAIMTAMIAFVCWIIYNEDKAALNRYYWFFGRRYK